MVTIREAAKRIIDKSDFFETPKEVLAYIKKNYDYKDVFECPFIMKSPKEGLYVAVTVEDVSVLGHVGFKSEYINTQVFNVLNNAMPLIDEIDEIDDN